MAPKTFLDLPAELKQSVFNDLIRGVEIKYEVGIQESVRQGVTTSVARTQVVAILFVSKQAYTDFLPILLRSASINIDSLCSSGKARRAVSFGSNQPVFARLQHINFSMRRIPSRFPLNDIVSVIPNLESVTVRSLSGARFAVFGPHVGSRLESGAESDEGSDEESDEEFDEESEAILHPRLLSDGAHEVWSTILRESSPNASSRFKDIVGAWKKSGKKFDLIVQARVLRDFKLVGVVNRLLAFMDLEDKTLEIKEEKGLFRTLVQLKHDSPDV